MCHSIQELVLCLTLWALNHNTEKILSSSKYESESETSTGSTLPLYTSSPLSPPLPSSSPSPVDSPPQYNMSQLNLHEIIRQQQEQLAAMQALVMNQDSRVKSRNNSCIGVTQENSIEFLVQSSLPYILVPMVCANYCAPYPK